MISNFNSIYHEMKQRNLDTIKIKGISYDNNLNNANNIEKCIALFNIFGTKYFNSKFKTLQMILKNKFTNDEIYDDNIHNTFMQLISFNKFDSQFESYEKNKQLYYNIINEIFSKYHKFFIHYYGIMIIPTGIIAIGYPSIDINIIRNELRNRFNSLNLSLYEPYHTNICHSTIFRFKTNKTHDEINDIINLCESYNNTYFGSVLIDSYNIGIGTWKLLPNEITIDNVIKLPLIKISHRGNIDGPNKIRENTISYINEALAKNLYVEIDIWVINNKIYLGHDSPDNEINIDFLYNDKLICHCKNLDALTLCLNKDIHCFSHDNDNYTITSNKWIWAYPGKNVNYMSICVLPEWNNQDYSNCLGYCSDYIK